jgi:hypothetical protein
MIFTPQRSVSEPSSLDYITKSHIIMHYILIKSMRLIGAGRVFADIGQPCHPDSGLAGIRATHRSL